MKKTIFMCCLLAILNLVNANAKLIVDELPNPTTSSSAYGLIKITGPATSIVYKIPQGYNNKNGYIQMKSDSKTISGSFLTNTGVVTGGVLKRIQFYINQDVTNSFDIYGLNAPANSTSDLADGEVLGTISVTKSGEYYFDFTKDYQYFALYIKKSTSTQVKDIKITWDDNSVEKENYIPTWGDLSVYNGYNTSIPLGLTYPTNITFSSADPSIASVDENGVVTGNKLGTTQITASWNEDEYFTATGSPFTVNVNVTERPLEREWNIIKYSNNIGGGSVVGVDAVCEGDPGTWHAYHPKSYVNDLQLGTEKYPFKEGILTLLDSNLPDNAYIKRIEMDVTGNYATSSSTWNATINGFEVEGELNFAGTVKQTLAFENVYIPGNQIVLTATSAVQGLKVSRIYVKFDEYKCPIAFTEITPNAKIVPANNGQFKIVMSNVSEDVEVYYQHTPATRSLAHEEFQKATRENDGSLSVIVNGYGNLKYYGYHPETDTKGIVGNIVVDNQTGIDENSISSHQSAFYNLQGIKVDEQALPPGIYLRRQGSDIVKVIVK